MIIQIRNQNLKWSSWILNACMILCEFIYYVNLYTYVEVFETRAEMIFQS